MNTPHATPLHHQRSNISSASKSTPSVCGGHTETTIFHDRRAGNQTGTTLSTGPYNNHCAAGTCIRNIRGMNTPHATPLHRQRSNISSASKSTPSETSLRDLKLERGRHEEA
ncbi:hypothetical protein SUGI_0476250 [Cryptomeria japonica]|nr:hypothetical protein SUGI_0476250 [Cryptomeria japonica]